MLLQAEATGRLSWRGTDSDARRATATAGARSARRCRGDGEAGRGEVIVDRALHVDGDRAGPVLGKTRRVHFIGIGGIGMSGIAELLANLGLRRQRVRTRSARAIDRSAGDAGRARRDTATPPRTSAAPTSWWSRRRFGATNPEVVEARAAPDSGDPARGDAGRADAAALRASRSPARTARRRRRR